MFKEMFKASHQRDERKRKDGWNIYTDWHRI